MLVGADLGRSFFATAPQTTHSIRGTLSHASHEITRQNSMTPLADVLSLWLILYEWPVGELPHTRGWEPCKLPSAELVAERTWRVGTKGRKPALSGPFRADFSMLVQCMLKTLHCQRLTARQVLACAESSKQRTRHSTRSYV